MKTKLKILAAIFCLIALSSCSVFTKGARYHHLNKVEASSQKSSSVKSKTETTLTAVVDTLILDTTTTNTVQSQAATLVNNTASVSTKKIQQPIISACKPTSTFRPFYSRAQIFSIGKTANKSKDINPFSVASVVGLFILLACIIGIKATITIFLIAIGISIALSLIALGAFLLLLYLFESFY